MAPKTVYIRDEDEEVWRKAEELATERSESLSAFVAQALRARVSALEPQYGLVTAYGRLASADPSEGLAEMGFAATGIAHAPGVVVYVTPKGNLVFRHAAPINGSDNAALLRVFSSLQDAMDATDEEGAPLYPPDLLARVTETVGRLRGKKIAMNSILSSADVMKGKFTTHQHGKFLDI